MKKLFIILFVLLFAIPAFALEVGDKMPDVSEWQFQSITPWSWDSRSGNYDTLDNHQGTRNMSEFAIVVYLVCDEKQLPLPYGIFLGDSLALYLDLNYNGLIDKIPVVPPKIGMLSPECPEPI